MRFYEVDSSVDAIMSAAMVAQTRASNTGKQGKLSMNGFLQMLANAGIMMDYDGFKTVFDTNPQLKNVIAQFNKDEITFVGDSDDEGAGYEEPQGDMPDDERVAKMAQRATKMRTREFVEATITEFDRHQDIIDQIVDMQPETSNEIIRMAQKLGAPDKAIDDILQAVLDKVNIDEFVEGELNEFKVGDKVKVKKGSMKSPSQRHYEKTVGTIVKDYGDDDFKVNFGGNDDLSIEGKLLVPDEAKLPPHLSKMFGKDGTQVDTRTDVMKQMRDIVDNKSAMKVKFGDGEQMVDMYTASVLVQVYDKVNPENKEKIVQRVGTIEKFTKLMPKLFGMIGEGSSPHPKGSKKYKAHMAAKHANMNEGKSMEDKIAADIEAGMSTDAIIGKYANKATTNTDEIRKMIQRIKFKNFRNK